MDLRDARVVFQDVDGCLNPPSGPFPDGPGQHLNTEQARLLAEISRAIDRSSATDVILNSGRSLNAMDFIVDGIESRKLRYLLAEHGAVAFDIAKQELIDLREIAYRCGPPERAARYAQLGPIRDAISWYNEEGESQISALFEHPLPALPKTANLTLRIPDGVPPREVIAAIERALIANDQVDSEGFVYHFGEFYVDVVSEVSKGDGALLLLEELGASPRKALAVGDGDNDISMFQVLGSCFCPANAAAELKRVCRRRSGVLSSLQCGEATLEFYLELGGPMS